MGVATLAFKGGHFWKKIHCKGEATKKMQARIIWMRREVEIWTKILDRVAVYRLFRRLATYINLSPALP